MQAARIPLKQKLILGLAPGAGAALLKGLRATWHVTEAGHTAESPLAHPKPARIYATWHECALSAPLFSGHSVHALASQSFDGELISRVLDRIAWLATARGSSSRGGGSGLKELAAYLEKGEPTLLTVDGPRGPRRKAKDGALQLARLSGHPVVPAVFACRPSFRLKSWDRMLIPPPFARGVLWYGKALRAGKDPEADLQALQRGLDQAGEAAEALLDNP